jgi:hypothetical protein
VWLGAFDEIMKRRRGGRLFAWPARSLPRLLAARFDDFLSFLLSINIQTHRACFSSEISHFCAVCIYPPGQAAVKLIVVGV